MGGGSRGGGNGKKQGDARPPAWASRLLERVIRRRVVREDVVVSMEVEFHRVWEAKGASAARRWYVRQALGIAVRAAVGGVGGEGRASAGSRLTGVGIVGVTDTLRLAARSVWSRRGVSAAVVVAVALGVGVTTAVVSVADAVLFRPLPYPEPDRLVQVVGTSDLNALLAGSANPYDVVDWKRAETFEAMAPYSGFSATLVFDRGPVRVAAARVGEGMDRVLGVRPALGRLFTEDDFAPGARSVVLAHSLWTERFGADPAIVGRSLDLSGTPFTVVGVLPPTDLAVPTGAGLWLPLALPAGEGGERRAGVWLAVMGRLRPGVEPEQADAELKSIATRLRQEHPATNAGRHVHVEPLRERIVGDAKPVVRLLSAAVALVLLIACANIGNLLLAVAQDRRRELAVRSALGSGLAGLGGLLLAESALLALVGSLLGVLLAPLGVEALLALYPGGLPRADEVAVNGTVLAVAAAATAVATLAAGLPPLLEARRLDLQKTLRAGPRGHSTRRDRRVRGGLVVAQVALSVALLVAGGLLLRTFRSLVRVDPGFVTEHVLTFNVSLPSVRYPEVEQETAFDEALLDRLRALPGVVEAGTATLLPLAGGDFLDGFQREGRDDEMPDLPAARLQIVTAGYLETLGIPLRRGRTVEPEDRSGAPSVVVVSEALERQYFPGGALGERIFLQGDWREVVGVVGDKRHGGLREEPVPDVYVPRGQIAGPRWSAWVAVRTEGDPLALVPAVRSVVRELEPTVPVVDPEPLSARLAGAVAPERFRAVIVGALALLAVVLAVLGLYGLVAFVVAREARETGIRLALGDAPTRVLVRTVGRAVALAGLGVGVGLAVALASGRFLAAFVPEIGTRDPLTLTVVPALFLAVAALAALGPAMRAGRFDPARILREE